MSKENSITIIKDQLIKHAEALMKLADDLQFGGKPLESYQKELIRGAFVPKLKELSEELAYAFAAGHNEHVSESFRQMDIIIGQINKL